MFKNAVLFQIFVFQIIYLALFKKNYLLLAIIHTSNDENVLMFILFEFYVCTYYIHVFRFTYIF